MVIPWLNSVMTVKGETLASATEMMPPVRRRYMTVGGVLAPVDDGLADSEFGYAQYTCLAGPLTSPARPDAPLSA